jgi:hypothetical protein
VLGVGAAIAGTHELGLTAKLELELDEKTVLLVLALLKLETKLPRLEDTLFIALLDALKFTDELDTELTSWPFDELDKELEERLDFASEATELLKAVKELRLLLNLNELAYDEVEEGSKSPLWTPVELAWITDSLLATEIAVPAAGVELTANGLDGEFDVEELPPAPPHAVNQALKTTKTPNLNTLNDWQGCILLSLFAHPCKRRLALSSCNERIK